MYHGYIDVPTFAYFDFGNVWAGSLLTDFNYRIIPKKPSKGDEEAAKPCFEVTIWYGNMCHDLSKPEEVFNEEFSEEGYERVIAKLNKRIDDYRTNVAYGGLNNVSQ